MFLSTYAGSVEAVLCSGASPITAGVLRLLPSLRLVVTASAGVNHIDLVECRRRGIAVANAGGVFSEDVADFYHMENGGASSRVWILSKFKDPYWKEKRTSPKDYYVGLRQEWKFRVEEQEGLVNDLRNMGVRVPHRRSLEMPTTNKREYEAAVSRIKEENNRMLMRRSSPINADNKYHLNLVIFVSS
ncbi:hypothetical protein RHGRI_001504 [Rhododendron griersonianum]|uniref:D-isomer specific 2-hydroxyacid dehydrogenase catalytic domain-containing protein n=1 Tax=Rhododendron griersonianum TaxID=479676 RepID=A0AAV6LKD6_9ERIC|nr:hypothetical protein RHGRI_001504 [Rhododendron griersonianum]